MELQPADPLVQGAAIVLAIASFAVWFAFFERREKGPILPFEPRRPVPWSGVWILLPILLTSMAVYSAMTGDAFHEDAEFSAGGIIRRIALGLAQEIALVAAFLVVVVAATGATSRDLGLPSDWRTLRRNIRIGVITWLASLAPVYCVQILLYSILGPTEGHPLIRMLVSHATPAIFTAVFVMAVIVAPFCEEVLFRLLLQGWLEKWEVARVKDETLMTNGEVGDPDHSPFVIRHSSFALGWLSILISSMLFGLAHAGYGAEPIPLFILGVILGYVYQRTHSILPTIVAHALFNGMTFFILWRSIPMNVP